MTQDKDIIERLSWRREMVDYGNDQWQPINTRPLRDDPMWFARRDGAGSWMVDGPQPAGVADVDKYEVWAPCECPPLPDTADPGPAQSLAGAVTVTIEDRGDGGIHISSSEAPGLILSGSSPQKVMWGVLPALLGLAEYGAALPAWVGAMKLEPWPAGAFTEEIDAAIAYVDDLRMHGSIDEGAAFEIRLRVARIRAALSGAPRTP